MPKKSVTDLTLLEKQGFLVIPSLVSSNVVDTLISALSEADVRVTRSRGVRNLASKVPGVRRLAGSSPIDSLVSEILGPGARLVRSILFDKVEGANWSLRWHQDLTVAVELRLEVAGYGPWSVKDGVHSVQPPAAVLEGMISVRLHLDDCGLDNGALQVIPGSHSSGKLSAQRRAHLIATTAPYVCEAPAGGAVVMRPLLLHSSASSRRPSHRRVAHLDFAVGDLAGGLEWSGKA